jgi:hypothetical protein
VSHGKKKTTTGTEVSGRKEGRLASISTGEDCVRMIVRFVRIFLGVFESVSE